MIIIGSFNLYFHRIASALFIYNEKSNHNATRNKNRRC